MNNPELPDEIITDIVHMSRVLQLEDLRLNTNLRLIIKHNARIEHLVPIDKKVSVDDTSVFFSIGKHKNAHVKISEHYYGLKIECYELDINGRRIWSLGLHKDAVLQDIYYDTNHPRSSRLLSPRLSHRDLVFYKDLIRASILIFPDFVNNKTFTEFFVDDLIKNPFWKLQKQTFSFGYDRSWNFFYPATSTEKKMRNIILGVLSPKSIRI